MTRTLTKLTAAAGLALMALSAAGAASAHTVWPNSSWERHHPRRTEVNERLAIQDYRINRERHLGLISHAQARDLHAEDRGIRAQERFDASHDRSHITRAEQIRLNHQENAVSRQIRHRG